MRVSAAPGAPSRVARASLSRRGGRSASASGAEHRARLSAHRRVRRLRADALLAVPTLSSDHARRAAAHSAGTPAHAIDRRLSRAASRPTRQRRGSHGRGSRPPSWNDAGRAVGLGRAPPRQDVVWTPAWRSAAPPPHTKRLMAPGPPSELEPRAGGVGERVDSSYYGSFFAGRQRVGRRLGFVPSVKLMAQMHFPGVRRRALLRRSESPSGRSWPPAGPCVQLRLRSPPKPLRRVRHDQRLRTSPTTT